MSTECGGDDGPTEDSSKATPTMLLRRASTGNLEQVIGILDSYGNTSLKSLGARGSTPLHEAAKGGHMKIVAELLRRSAEINTVNRTGCTALHFATLGKDKIQAKEIAECLIDAKANVNTLNRNMDSALHFAAYCQPSLGCGALIRLLITEQADVNVRNRNRDTPAINACLHDNVEAVKELIALGAGLTFRNHKDKDIHDVAAERGHPEMLTTLEAVRDPVHQLNALTEKMRAAFDSMQTCDMLSRELQRTATAKEAYEQAALALATECLDEAACARVATKALCELCELEERCLVPPRTSCASTVSSPTLVPPRTSCASTVSTPMGRVAFGSTLTARTPDVCLGSPALSVRSCISSTHATTNYSVPLQQRLVQALVLLLLVSRAEDGAALLHKIGFCEVLPLLEHCTIELQSGEKELRDLKIILRRFFDDDHMPHSATTSHAKLDTQQTLAVVYANAKRLSQDMCCKAPAGDTEECCAPRCCMLQDNQTRADCAQEPRADVPDSPPAIVVADRPRMHNASPPPGVLRAAMEIMKSSEAPVQRMRRYSTGSISAARGMDWPNAF